MHDYLFSHESEKDNMFSNTSAVVIEFYAFQAIANNPNWRIRTLLGWVAIRLDTRTYDALTSPGSNEGMRTEGTGHVYFSIVALGNTTETRSLGWKWWWSHTWKC